MSKALDCALEPGARAMVADMLEPPDGMTLRRGVLTSFTLDLATALIVPLIVAGHDADDPAAATPRIAGLPYAMERLAVFLEAGQLSGRDAGSEVGTLIAPMLREVLVPDRTPGALHTFHPKLFALQFRAREDGSGARVRRDVVRLVIGSRNLSRSTSRDLAVVMEGEVGTAGVASRRRNEPVASLLRALPGMRVDRDASAHRGSLLDEEVEALAEAVERTEFEAPDGFAFEGFALGMKGQIGWRPERCDRFTVVSPFCQDDTLAAYGETSGAGGRVLVSRRETLAKLKPGTLDEWDTYGFGGAAAAPNETDGADPGKENAAVAEPPGDEADEIDRLHAKLYVEERAGAPARLTIGSGNATDPAREGRNIETYAVLRTLGDLPDPLPEPFAAGSATAALDPLVTRYEPDEDIEGLLEDEGEEGGLGSREGRLLTYELLDGCYGLRFERADDGWACRIECRAAPELLGPVRVTARPVTASPDVAARLDALGMGEGHDFPAVPLADLTPFVEFTIAVHDGGGGGNLRHTASPRGVPNVGAPGGRAAPSPAGGGGLALRPCGRT